MTNHLHDIEADELRSAREEYDGRWHDDRPTAADEESEEHWYGPAWCEYEHRVPNDPPQD